jgi:hypothetical protein
MAGPQGSNSLYFYSRAAKNQRKNDARLHWVNGRFRSNVGRLLLKLGDPSHSAAFARYTYTHSNHQVASYLNAAAAVAYAYLYSHAFAAADNRY